MPCKKKPEGRLKLLQPPGCRFFRHDCIRFMSGIRFIGHVGGIHIFAMGKYYVRIKPVSGEDFGRMTVQAECAVQREVAVIDTLR